MNVLHIIYVFPLSASATTKHYICTLRNVCIGLPDQQSELDNDEDSDTYGYLDFDDGTESEVDYSEDPSVANQELEEDTSSNDAL